MSTYPEATSVVIKKYYMDDFLDLFENVTHAVKNRRDLFRFLSCGDLFCQ